MNNVENVLLGDAVVFQHMLAHQFHLILKRSHLQLVADDTQHIVACHDSDFRKKCLQHLQMTVADAIEHNWVYVFKDDMLFYHVISINFLQNYKMFLLFV